MITIRLSVIILLCLQVLTLHGQNGHCSCDGTSNNQQVLSNNPIKSKREGIDETNNIQQSHSNKDRRNKERGGRKKLRERINYLESVVANQASVIDQLSSNFC